MSADLWRDGRPLRSWLYVPAHDARKLAKAGTAGADVVILDLEDGVPAAAKEEARQGAAEWLRDADRGGALAVVRTRPAEDLDVLGGDVAAVAPSGPDALVLPKAETPEQVAALASRAGADVPLVVIVETPGGVLDARALAGHPAVVGVAVGAEDLATETGLRPAADPAAAAGLVRQVRTQVVLAARAAGALVLDSPFVDHRDAEGLARRVREAVAMGFDGIQAIHPGQVPVIHEAAAPSEAELEHARKVVAALDGVGGATTVAGGGPMVDAPHLRAAQRLLAMAGPEVSGRDGGAQAAD